MSTAGSARLFTALELPRSVVATLDGWAQAELASVGAGSPAGAGMQPLRRVGAEALHVTLCFLGSRPVAEIEAIASACSVLSGQGSIPLRLGAPVWLPRRRPRVLALGLEDDQGGLARVQEALSVELQRGGWYEPERRRFTPHVTVGRFGRPGGREVPMAAPPPLAFQGSSVGLLRSWPERGGSRYERLAVVSLTG